MGRRGGEGGEEVGEGQGTGNGREGVGMPGEGEERGGKGRRREEGEEGEAEGRNVRTSPPSIPAYAPGAWPCMTLILYATRSRTSSQCSSVHRSLRAR